MFDYLIKKTKTYKKLKNRYKYLRHVACTQDETQKEEIKEKENKIAQNKELAKLIKKALISLIKKDEIVQAKRDIEKLCNQIIGDWKC